MQSNADGFIDKLTDQYNTPLMRIFEENGVDLSIGQWQKLAVARAFYSDSDILILDEPTASLDAIAEQEIFNQFDELRKNKTTIFVSHRLSSATTATKIIVLEQGELVEMGNHAELMKLKGRYYELFTTQAKRYLAEDGDKIIGEDGNEMFPDGGHMVEGEMPEFVPNLDGEGMQEVPAFRPGRQVPPGPRPAGGPPLDRRMSAKPGAAHMPER